VFGPEEERRRDIYIVGDDGKTVDHLTLSGNLRLLINQDRDTWSDELRPIHFFPDGRSEALQLDIGGSNGHHLQLALNPLTGRAQVTQLYDAQQQAVPPPPQEPGAENVHVIPGGTQ
jgi:hypothetical protein